MSELLEPLVIVEEGDATEAAAAALPAAAVKEEGPREAPGDGPAPGQSREGKENANEVENRDRSVTRSPEEKSVKERAGEEEEEEERQTKCTEEAQEQERLKKARRLTPDFPDALYELLCTLQEGRRLNDQRCSFTMEGLPRRRRCHSEPNASKPAHRVVFSSMTSLQKEEFFELVAAAQARRLNDQRAALGSSSPPPRRKSRSFRGSLRHLSVRRLVPAAAASAPAPKDDLYDMILSRQAQGRLEDQRSRAPGPMDDEDFFSLLLRVQGGRMDEQRTELPRLLKT